MNMFVHTLCPSPPPYHPKVRTYGGETGFNVHAVSIASISPDPLKRRSVSARFVDFCPQAQTFNGETGSDQARHNLAKQKEKGKLWVLVDCFISNSNLPTFI